MKITIDTKEDSHQEIKKAIAMLNSLVEAGAASGGASGDTQPIVGEGIFGMFSGNSEENAPETRPSGGNELAGFFSENREESANIPEPKIVEGLKKSDDDEDIRVVPY